MAFSLVKRSGLFLLLFCLGCSGQSAAPTEVDRRVERLVRAHFSVPPSVNVKLGERRPSPEFSGYDLVTVTLSRGERSSSFEFLLSKDGKRLLQMVPIEDPMEKIDLAGRPVRGNQNAKVTIVNYDDFQCPYCGRNHQILMTHIFKQYGDRVRIIYKDYPLETIHPWARHAAIDANCLAQQNHDAYWDFADYVHLNQKEVSGTNRSLSDQFAALDQAAEEAGRKHNARTADLQACLKAQPDAVLNASLKEAELLGVTATPTMFVNGQKLDGAVPAPEIRQAIDHALTEAGQVPPASAGANPNNPSP